MESASGYTNQTKAKVSTYLASLLFLEKTGHPVWTNDGSASDVDILAMSSFDGQRTLLSTGCCVTSAPGRGEWSVLR
jgi:hypothetical protein